jgi:flagellar basal-body rod modification protein FlgD
MASVSSVYGSWTNYEDTINTEKSENLGKEDFLKLLIAQLTHQDPTEPMKDTEFVAQLATYSGLEQQMNMNKNLETLIASNNASTAANAIGLIGMVVGFTNADGQLQTGQVAFLDIVGGEVNLVLFDGTYIPFSDVEQVGYPIEDADTSGTTPETPETPENNED